MTFEIRKMRPEECEGLSYTAAYTTDRYYDVVLLEDGFRLEEKQAEPPLEKRFTDTLLGDWLEAPVVFGAFAGGELLGFVEGSPESWHRLFRVSNLFVYPQHRRKGVAQALLRHITAYARAQGEYRGVILETQTSNYAAVTLYRQLGFRLTRIDIAEYSNADVEAKEVRIDLLLKF